MNELTEKSEFFRCAQIQPGMIFEPCADGATNPWRKDWNDLDSKKTWIVLSRDERSRHNSLFFCSPVGNPKRIELMCFDQIFRAKEHNFRFPDEST